jgi:hypothetical protein
MVDKKKIEDKIKDLNSIRPTYQRYLIENEKKHLEKKITDEVLEKHKKTYEKRIEKIKILKLERKINQLETRG